jgi:RNA polymerase sigma-70 factor (ECF subfamily)
MPSSSTRPSLLDRLRDRRDDEAWREFAERYRDLLLRYALRRGLAIHDAEDVVQASLGRLARSLTCFEYRPELGTFRAYLLRVVENELRRAAERRRAGPAQIPLEEWDDHAAPPPPERDALWEEEWIQHHYRLALAKVRGAVTPQTSAVFQELMDGVAPLEIAARHGLGVDAVYKIKQRMRDRLQAAVDAQVRAEEFRELRG